MPLYMPRERLNANDQAAAGARTSSLVDDVTRQYRQAQQPPEPTYELPDLGSLGVSDAPSPIMSAVGSIGRVGQQAAQAAQDAFSWALPSLESLGVTQPKPATMPTAPQSPNVTIEDGRTDGSRAPVVAPGERIDGVTVTNGAGYAPSTGRGEDGVEQWSSIVSEAARQYGLPEATIKGLMEIESGGNPGARSAAGAMGLMQVMPFHFGEGEDGMDPRTNIFKGAKVYADALRRWGDPDKAAAAYFGAIDGEGNITGATDATGTDGHKYVALWRQAASKYGGTWRGDAGTPPARPDLSGNELGTAPNVTPSPSDVRTYPNAGPSQPAASPPTGAPAASASAAPQAAGAPPDTVTITDDAMGRTLIVPRSTLPGYLRPPAPGVPSPWRVVEDGRQAQMSALDQARAGADGFQASALSLKDMGEPADMPMQDGMAPPSPPVRDDWRNEQQPPTYTFEQGGPPTGPEVAVDVAPRPQVAVEDGRITPAPDDTGRPWVGPVETRPRPEPPVAQAEPDVREQSMAGLIPVWNADHTQIEEYIRPAWEGVKRAATGLWEAAKDPQNAVDTLGAAGARALEAGSRAAVEEFTPPTTPGEVAARNARDVGISAINPVAGAIAPTVRIIEAARDAFGDEVGRRVGRAMGANPDEIANVLGQPITGEDVAGFVGSAALDPTNFIGVGPAARGAREVAEAAGPAARRGARALAEEGARQLMDLTPTPRVIQEGGGGFQRPTRAIEQAIRAEHGNPYPDIRNRIGGTQEQTLGEASAEMVRDAKYPREVVHPDLRGETMPRVDDIPPSSINLNMGVGPQPGPLARRESLPSTGSRAARAADDIIDNPNYDDAMVALRDDIKWHNITIDRLRESLRGGDGGYTPDYARQWLPVYERELADMEARYSRMIGDPEALPVEPISARTTSSPEPSRGPGALAQLNADLGNSVFGSIVGTSAGAMAPAETDEERRRNMGIGLAAGALGYPAVGRMLPRAEGALQMVGPQGRPPARVTVNGRVVRASSSKPPNLLEIAQAYRHSFGMLGNIGTGLLNAMGGPISAGSGLATDVIRTGLMKGYPVPAVAEAGSLVAGLGEAARDALGTALGFVPQRVRNAPDFRPPLAERMEGPVGKTVGWVIDTPGRLATQTPDAFFGALFNRMGRRRAANELMMEAGTSRLDPVAQMQEVQRLLNNPTPGEAARIDKLAREFSDELTYKGDEGYWEKALSGWFRAPGGPTTANSPVSHQVHDLVGSFLMPFYSSIFKIHKLAATHTPGLGLVADTSKPMSERIARQLVGLGFGIWAADRAAQNLVTGPGPDDPDEKARLKAAGWDEWSTYLPGLGYVKSDNLAQAAPFLKTIGAYYDSQRYGSKGPTPGDDLEQGEAVVKKLLSAFEGFPVLRTISDLYKAAEHPIEGGANMAINAASSLVPAAVRSAEASKDPYQRTIDRNAPMAERIKQSAQNRLGSIPGVGSRRDSPPALDRKGEPVENPRAGWGAFIPQPKQPKEEDPVIAEMGRYGVDLDRARDRWAFTRAGADSPDGAPGSVRVMLKQEWQQEWLRARWQKIQEDARTKQADPRYASANEGVRRNVWNNVIQNAETYADRVVKNAHRAEIEEMIRVAPVADPLPQRRAS